MATSLPRPVPAFGPNHVWLAQSLNNLALVYRNEGKFDQAEPPVLRSVSIYEKARGPESLDTAPGLVLLADLDLQRNKPDLAGPLLERALKIYDKTPPKDAYPRSMHIRALALAGRTDEARAKAEALRTLGFGRRDFVELCKKLGVKTGG